MTNGEPHIRKRWSVIGHNKTLSDDVAFGGKPFEREFQLGGEAAHVSQAKPGSLDRLAPLQRLHRSTCILSFIKLLVKLELKDEMGSIFRIRIVRMWHEFYKLPMEPSFQRFQVI